jgi:hypothetical protein
MFNGRRFQLTEGRYVWYVWPGFGKRSHRRYGKLITHRTLTVNQSG